MSLRQSIVWIEEKQACIIRVDNGLHLESTIVAQPLASHAATSNDNAATEQDDSYFGRVTRALAEAHEILVVGPSVTKLDLIKYLNKNDHGYDARILGVETVDAPDDVRLEGYAKLYFTSGGPRRS